MESNKYTTVALQSNLNIIHHDKEKRLMGRFFGFGVGWGGVNN